jgi:hypothetical protein
MSFLTTKTGIVLFYNSTSSMSIELEFIDFADGPARLETRQGQRQ